MIKDNLSRAITHLKGKKVLLITTSNRWSGSEDTPKSTILSNEFASQLDATTIDITKLKIYNCEGNISDKKGNHCGTPGSRLDDATKNPTGNHRCWASLNNPDDELWKVSRAMFEHDAVIFFISTRWGQANAFYQKLLERLSWIENRWSTQGDVQLMKGKIAGCVVIGHNWNTNSIMENQMQVYRWFGFEVPRETSFCWQWTSDSTEESAEGYLQDPIDFKDEFSLGPKWLTESFKKWFEEK